MPKFNDDDEEKLTPEELDKKIEELVGQATDDLIVKHIKEGFVEFGIEGAEDVFRRVYQRHPVILERYQKLYDQLIGRNK